MVGSIDDRIRELGLEIPAPPTPLARYVPFARLGNLVQLSGVAPTLDGHLISGS